MTFVEKLDVARSGNAAILNTIIDVYCVDLSGFIQRQVRGRPESEQVAEDIMQEVLHQVHRDIGTFKGDSEGEFLAWIHQIARNRVKDQIRRDTSKKRQCDLQRLIDVGEEVSRDGRIERGKTPSPSGAAMKKEAAAAVHDAIAQLPEHERLVVQMHYIDGYTLADIAQLGNQKANVVRATLQRAREHLKSKLDKSGVWLSYYR